MKTNNIEKKKYNTNSMKSSSIKPTDECFVLCSDNNCFTGHRIVKRAERVNVCVFIRNLGLVNWD